METPPENIVDLPFGSRYEFLPLGKKAKEKAETSSARKQPKASSWDTKLTQDWPGVKDTY